MNRTLAYKKRHQVNRHNMDIKQLIIDRKLSIGFVARKCGYARDDFEKRLQMELPEKQKRMIKDIIEQISD